MYLKTLAVLHSFINVTIPVIDILFSPCSSVMKINLVLKTFMLE